MFGMRFVCPSVRRSASLRRASVAAGIVIAFATIATTMWIGYSAAPVRASNILLLYVGAEDCAPCRAWQNGQGAVFFASADFTRITYREVKSPHLHEILKDENWPKEIRRYRDSLRRSDGVPLWVVVADDKVVERSFGAAEWRASVLPTIRSLLR